MRYLCIIIVLLAYQVEATTYYVANVSEVRPGTYYDTKASDANNGTTVSTPFVTMGHAVAQLAAGDTLYVMGGVFNDKTEITGAIMSIPDSSCIWLDVSGTEGNDIVIKSYIGDSCTTRAEIQNHDGGVNSLGWGTGFAAEIEEYITLDSLVFDSCAKAGVLAYRVDNLTIKNCVMHDIWESADPGEANTGGIFWNEGRTEQPGDTIYNENWLIYEDTVYNIRNDDGNIGVSDNANGMHGRALKNSIIRNCVLHDMYYGIRLKTDNDSNFIDSNLVYTCIQGGGYDVGSNSRGNIVRFNTYAQEGGNGSGFMLIHSGGVDASDSNYIYNNVAIGENASGRGGFVIGDWASNDQITNNSIFNNISMEWPDGSSTGYNNLNVRTDTPQIIIDYNCYYDTSSTNDVLYETTTNMTLATWQANPFGADANSRHEDPQFRSVIFGNEFYLHLDTLSTPDSILTGGRGGEWPTHMGPFDPYPAVIKGKYSDGLILKDGLEIK